MKNIQIDPQNHEQQLAYELVANTNSSFFSHRQSWNRKDNVSSQCTEDSEQTIHYFGSNRRSSYPCRW